MRQRFRFMALWLLCLMATGLSAQTWTASAPAEGTFFLYNVGNAGFLYGANDWGTRASITMVKIAASYSSITKNIS